MDAQLNIIPKYAAEINKAETGGILISPRQRRKTAAYPGRQINIAGEFGIHARAEASYLKPNIIFQSEIHKYSSSIGELDIQAPFIKA